MPGFRYKVLAKIIPIFIRKYKATGNARRAFKDSAQKLFNLTYEDSKRFERYNQDMYDDVIEVVEQLKQGGAIIGSTASNIRGGRGIGSTSSNIQGGKLVMPILRTKEQMGGALNATLSANISHAIDLPYRPIDSIRVKPTYATNTYQGPPANTGYTGGARKCSPNEYCIIPGASNPYAYDVRTRMVWSIAGPGHQVNNCYKKISGNFELYPNTKKERECIYISGPSGSGKTYFAKQYIQKYTQLYPGNKIMLFSNKDLSGDKGFHLRYFKPPVTHQFVDNLKVNKVCNSLLIFDDVENIVTDKDIAKKLYVFMEECLNVGRSMHVTILIISHVMLNYKFTRNIIMECNKIVMFPMSGARFQYQGFLKRYLGMDNKQISNLLNVKSRWMVIDKECPLSLLTQFEFRLL